MQDSRMCIIGGGSRQWAIKFMKDLSLNKGTRGTLVLYDIDKEAARNNVAVAERVFRINHREGDLRAVAEDDLGKALEGCRFVVISIEPGSTSCRKGDLLLPEEYGIYQTVGDTTGPGGIMRARRALPLFFDFARAIEKYCPDAWVINYTNPMTLCTAALFRAWPGIKAMGCCHEVFKTEKALAEFAGQWYGVPVPDRRDITIDLTGVNHFTWITEASWHGHDLMPRLKKLVASPGFFKDETDVALERIKNEKWFDCDRLLAYQLLRDFGALGAAGDRHLAEFVPWYLDGGDAELRSYGVIRTPYEWREREAARKRNEVFQDDELVAKKNDEEGVDIMLSLFGDRTLKTNINRPNEGQISFLPRGRIVESLGYIADDTIRPIVAKDPPLGVQTLIKRVSDEQQMVLDAVWNKDDDELFAAFLLDPLVHIRRSRARELFDRMLAASALVY